jgi:hypothetical protein
VRKLRCGQCSKALCPTCCTMEGSSLARKMCQGCYIENLRPKGNRGLELLWFQYCIKKLNEMSAYLFQSQSSSVQIRPIQSDSSKRKFRCVFFLVAVVLVVLQMFCSPIGTAFGPIVFSSSLEKAVLVVPVIQNGAVHKNPEIISEGIMDTKESNPSIKAPHINFKTSHKIGGIGKVVPMKGMEALRKHVSTAITFCAVGLRGLFTRAKASLDKLVNRFRSRA